MAGETAHVALGLAPLPEAKGVVLDPEGKPVAGAAVRLSLGPEQRTDAEGRFARGARTNWRQRA